MPICIRCANEPFQTTKRLIAPLTCRIFPEVHISPGAFGAIASAGSVPPAREAEAWAFPRVRQSVRVLDRHSRQAWMGVPALAGEQKEIEIELLLGVPQTVPTFDTSTYLPVIVVTDPTAHTPI